MRCACANADESLATGRDRARLHDESRAVCSPPGDHRVKPGSSGRQPGMTIAATLGHAHRHGQSAVRQPPRRDDCGVGATAMRCRRGCGLLGAVDQRAKPAMRHHGVGTAEPLWRRKRVTGILDGRLSPTPSGHRAAGHRGDRTTRRRPCRAHQRCGGRAESGCRPTGTMIPETTWASGFSPGPPPPTTLATAHTAGRRCACAASASRVRWLDSLRPSSR